MKLSHLRNVVAAAECGSLRAAARQLGIAQPAITRSIREIENELGAPLFERHQQGMRLTAMGEAFLRRAKAVQAELRRAQEEIGQMKGEMRGQVCFAMSAVTTFALMPGAVRAFRARYPEPILKLTEGFFQNVETSILDGQLDFYVGPFVAPGGVMRFQWEALYDNQRVVIARRGHALAGATSLGDLREAEWVKQTLTERGSDADFERPFESRSLPLPRVVMHTTSATATLLAVANSDLLTIVPARMLSPPIAADLFDVLQLDTPLTAPPICIVRRADLPLTPLAEHLCDMIRRAAVKYRTPH